MDFVTGGTGFVGWHVARKLSGRGERVRALVREGTDARHLEELPGVEIVRGDLRDGGAAWDRRLEGCRRLFHVGALYTLWLRRPREIYETNVAGTVGLIEAARRAAIRRIVYTSTVGALGLRSDGGSADETTPVTLEQMVGHYKRSKFLAEREVGRLADAGAPVVIVNPSAPVGAGDRKPTPTGRMILDFLCRRMPAYLDTGLNLVDVEDVAEGHLLAAERGAVGERYILGNENLTLKEIFALLERLSGLPAPRFQMPYAIAYLAGAASSAAARVTGRPPRVPLDAVRMARKKMFFDPGKAVRDLGLPQTPVEEALGKAIDWFRSEHSLSS